MILRGRWSGARGRVPRGVCSAAGYLRRNNEESKTTAMRSDQAIVFVPVRNDDQEAKRRQNPPPVRRPLDLQIQLRGPSTEPPGIQLGEGPIAAYIEAGPQGSRRNSSTWGTIQ